MSIDSVDRRIQYGPLRTIGWLRLSPQRLRIRIIESWESIIEGDERLARLDYRWIFGDPFCSSQFRFRHFRMRLDSGGRVDRRFVFSAIMQRASLFSLFQATDSLDVRFAAINIAPSSKNVQTDGNKFRKAGRAKRSQGCKLDRRVRGRPD